MPQNIRRLKEHYKEKGKKEQNGERGYRWWAAT